MVRQTQKNIALEKHFFETPNEQAADLFQRFLTSVIAAEKLKFHYFCLVRNKRIAVTKAGSDKEAEKAFLGYEWSKRRGFEGMRMIGDGKLFDPTDPRNSKKASSYIRRSFLDEEVNDVDESIKAHVSIVDLADTIDFSEPECDLRISTDPTVTLPVAVKYPSIRFDKIAKLEYGKALKASKRTPGAFPVMGSNGPDGTHDKFLVKGPAIVVGRKGSAGKIAFSSKNCWPIDTTFWVKFDDARLDPIFLYWTLLWLDLTKLVGRKGIGVPGLNRKDVHKQMFPDVPIRDQKKIVRKLVAIDDSLRDAHERRLVVIDQSLR